MRPATARGRRANSPQGQVDPAMAARLKELEASRKDDERQKKLAERKRAQELREAKKKLSRELQGAQRMLTRSEQEVNKLQGQLNRTEQQAQQATVKKTREGEKAEEGIGRIRTKHGKVNTTLREKMANVGQARGRLAHVQFAMAMLEKGVIVAVGEDGAVPAPDTTMLNQTQPRRRVVKRMVVVDHDEDGNPVEEEVEVEEEEGEEEMGGHSGQEADDQSEGPSLRDELEQLKEENQKLREHLADADKRCTTAVQLLQQAQEVLETRMEDMTTADFKIRVEGMQGLQAMQEKDSPDFENASTMHGSPDSTQHSPSAFPQDAGYAGVSALPALPSLLSAPRPEIKQVPVYAGNLSPPPNRMVSCPMNVHYRPAQLPQQDSTMPMGSPLMASQSTSAISYPRASMTIPSAQKMYPAEPVAVPQPFRPMAEPVSFGLR